MSNGMAGDSGEPETLVAGSNEAQEGIDPSRVFTPARHPLLRAFAYRDYRLFFGGQLVSLIGTWMQSVAQSWLVYRLTGSAVLLGLVGFAGQIPVLILAPVGGSVADTRSRHRIIIKFTVEGLS